MTCQFLVWPHDQRAKSNHFILQGLNNLWAKVLGPTMYLSQIIDSRNFKEKLLRYKIITKKNLCPTFDIFSIRSSNGQACN